MGHPAQLSAARKGKSHPRLWRGENPGGNPCPDVQALHDPRGQRHLRLQHRRASQKVIAKAARIVHPERLQRHLAAGRPAVIAINHIGNWELYAQMVFMMPEIKFGTVYQALRNKPLDDLINQDRRRLGVATFDRKRGFNEAIALLRQPGVVGVLVDQNAGMAAFSCHFSTA